MFMALCALALLVTVPLLGGHLGELATLRLRQRPLLVVALALQIVITDIIDTAPRPLLVTIHLVTYAMAGYVIWANRGISGLVVIAIGGGLNGAVIALNGGTLPASASALRQAGIGGREGDFTNTGVLAHPHLAWLGDIVATPAWLPERNVLSIGDVLVIVGVAILLHSVCRSRPARALAALFPRTRAVQEVAYAAEAVTSAA